jgi:hypothetical protein
MTRKATQKEYSFQRQVIAFAALHGWRTAHFRPGMNRRGEWQTAVQGDGSGFPDLILIRERVVWAELKSETGVVSGEQRVWIDALVRAGQEVYVWRPSDWAEIEEVLG